MKKLFSAIILSTLVLGMAVPAVVSADIETELSEDCAVERAGDRAEDCLAFKGKSTCNVKEDDCAFCCTLNIIYKVTDWVFYILMATVTLMIIYGGFLYVTAAGDPEKAGKGRQVLTYALVGFAIAILAKIIPAFVKYFIGVGGGGATGT